MSKSSMRAFLAGLAMLLVFGGVTHALAADPAVKESGPALRVTYLVYSGRPNPVVTLTDPVVVSRLEARLSRALLAPSRPGVEVQQVLGYNGILIERVGTSVSRPEQFVVKGEVLRTYALDKDAARSATAPESTRASPAAFELETSLLALGETRGALDTVTLNVVNNSRN